VPFGVAHSIQVFVGGTVRVPLLLPPGTGVTFSVQAFTLVHTPLTCTGQQLAASPAIAFSY
jgi:hypothetical protein